MITPEIPFLDTLYISDQLKDYASPKSKLTNLIKSGKLIKIRRGLYIPGDLKNYSIMTLANKIYGPSYVSFESALSYHGLIPERVQSISSAVFNKNKDRVFHTPAGTFMYKYTNAEVYPHGIIHKDDQNYPFLIASKEKALCDTLSKIRGIMTLKDLKELILYDLRIYEDEIKSLNIEDISFLESLYKKKIITLLKQFLQKENSHA